MNNFFITIDVSASYITAAPILELLVDGEVFSSQSVTSKTGSGSSTLSFQVTTASGLSSLGFRFNDNFGESGRSVTINKVTINNQDISPTVFVFNDGGNLGNQNQAILDDGETLDLNVNALDYIFGSGDAQLSDLGAVTLTGTANEDTIYADKGGSVIDAGNGNDEVRAGQGDDNIYGGEGNDRIYGHLGNDFIIGGAGNDALFGRQDHDLIYGGDGDDRVNGGEGNDVLSGGAGIDRLYGEAGNDIIDGGADNDIIYAQEGDDVVDGGSGNDNIRSGTGDDVLNGGSGDDKLIAEGGANTLNGGIGEDTLIADHDADVDTLNGGEGDDDLFGGNGDDVINGDEDDDRIEGRDGNDTINGGTGSDLIYGQNGDDTIYGGDGARDDLYGGHGADRIYGEDGFDKIFGEGGKDILYGGAGNDVIRGGDSADTIYGDADNDRLFGENGDDVIYGGDGDDFIRGLANADTIYGGDGNDTIIHDDNIDILVDGGADYDILHLAGTNTNDINVTTGDLNAINIEQISLDNYNGIAATNNLILSISDVSSISSSDTLYITGDVGTDTVTVNSLDAVTNFVGSVTVNTIGYDHYLQGGLNLYVQTGVTLLTSSAPIALDDVFAGTEGSNINGSVLADNGNGADYDPIGNPIFVQADTITTAGGGTVNLLGTGNFTYVPATDFFGVDSFTYTVENSLGETDNGLVTLNVAGVNDGPIAQDDEFTVTKNLAFTGDLLADNGNGADTDIETLVLSTQVETISSLNGATVEINGDGTFTYTPATGFIGPDSFSYTLLDDDGGSDTANVSVNVTDAISLPGGTPTINLSTGSGTFSGDGFNTGGPFNEKSTVVNFDTGADITTRQVIFEQGGGTRGINFYIEGGNLHMATWNFAEENWGYQEVVTSISANTEYSAALILDGELPNTGTITGYLDGSVVGTDTGVGLLYDHAGGSVGEASGSSVYGGSSSSANNTFLGEVDGVVNSNRLLTEAELGSIDQYLETPTAIFAIENFGTETVPNDPAINDQGPYAEKTLGVAFSTGADVTTRQVIYEQGGTVRGLSIYIEAGQLHIASWNFAEENWGYKEVTTSINANEFYTATLILDGTLAETGTLTGYVNGSQIGQETDVGLLYGHPGAIGIGEMVNGSVYGGVSDGGNGNEFTGTIHRLAQYNDALSGDYLIDLQSANAAQNPNVVGNTFVGDANDNSIGGGNGDDNIQAREGNDTVSGNGGNDTLRGEEGDDTLYGNSGDDTLYGGTDNDTLVGGTGVDLLFGEGGSDTFGFVQIDGEVDQIRDFTLSGPERDFINITDILDGYNPGTSNIADYVLINVVNSNRTDIRIDANGDGSGYQTIAIVRGSDLTGNDAQDLLDAGTLIANQSVI